MALRRTNNSIFGFRVFKNGLYPRKNNVYTTVGQDNLVLDQIKPNITNREQEVLYLISEGFRTEEIAARLFISPQTVSTHRKRMIKKFQARTTPHLVRIAIQIGLI